MLASSTATLPRAALTFEGIGSTWLGALQRLDRPGLPLSEAHLMWQAGSTSIVEGEKEAWWLDDRTKRLFEQTMRLNGTLTFTVRPGAPLQLTREQVRHQLTVTLQLRTGCCAG